VYAVICIYLTSVLCTSFFSVQFTSTFSTTDATDSGGLGGGGAFLKAENEGARQRACGLCLLNVDYLPTASSAVGCQTKVQDYLVVFKQLLARSM